MSPCHGQVARRSTGAQAADQHTRARLKTPKELCQRMVCCEALATVTAPPTSNAAHPAHRRASMSGSSTADSTISPAPPRQGGIGSAPYALDHPIQAQKTRLDRRREIHVRSLAAIQVPIGRHHEAVVKQVAQVTVISPPRQKGQQRHAGDRTPKGKGESPGGFGHHNPTVAETADGAQVILQARRGRFPGGERGKVYPPAGLLCMPGASF